MSFQKKIQDTSLNCFPLESNRSPCYPYALFLVDGADLDHGNPDLDVVKIEDADSESLQDRLDEYVRSRFDFNLNKLRIKMPVLCRRASM